MGTLPVNYALDLRKLSFQQKQSVHHVSVMNLLFSLTASKEFELLCKNYSVIQPQAHGRFRACVWQAFICHLASFYLDKYFYCAFCTLSVYIFLPAFCLSCSTLYYVS